jgi:hypothetical protein
MTDEYLWVSPSLNSRSVYETSRVSISAHEYTAPETAELNVANDRPKQVWGLRGESLNLEIRTLKDGKAYDLTLNKSTEVRPLLEAIKKYGKLSGVNYPLDFALKFADIQGVVIDGHLVGLVMNHPSLDLENEGPKDIGLIDQ